jgi:heme/copper-type cytochrome/quinol oxidase subunit 4
MNADRPDEPRKPSLGRVFSSVIASMFGVQSSRRRQEDFTSGSPWAYIVVGTVMTVLFILAVWLVVKLVLKAAGV